MLEKYKLWITNKLNPIYLQIGGILAIIIAYVLFGISYTYTGWAVMVIVGIDELLLIWVWKLTITAFARKLLPKRVDTIILLGLVPVTWWLFTPRIAGIYLIGLLMNHFTEIQPKV